MTKSYAQMADEILKGALTNPAKNPYDPAQGHQADLPSMDPNDKLVEMTDAQRHALLKSTAGVSIQEIKESKRVEKPAPPSTIAISEQDLQILDKAKRIITRIQEATTVGNIGVSMVGREKGKDPKSVKLPGDTNVSQSPKKRVKKSEGNDFLAYLGGAQ